MNTKLCLLLSGALALTASIGLGQFGPGGAVPQAPNFSGAMGKLFGQNQNFSANVELETKLGSGQTMSMPAKLAVLDGKSRFELDMTQAKSASMPAQAVAQMKSMGMDKMVMISRPDKKLSYMVYPNLHAYAEAPVADPDAAKPASDFKVDLTELGKETVAGHPCVKQKAVVTDNEGKKHEATLWAATDLHNFPVKMEQMEQGNMGTMFFSDIKLTKPDANLFEPPADMTKYASPQALMQQEMMKRFRGGQGVPPQ